LTGVTAGLNGLEGLTGVGLCAADFVQLAKKSAPYFRLQALKKLAGLGNVRYIAAALGCLNQGNALVDRVDAMTDVDDAFFSQERPAKEKTRHSDCKLAYHHILRGKRNTCWERTPI